MKVIPFPESAEKAHAAGVRSVLAAALSLARAALTAELAPEVSVQAALVLAALARYPGSTASQLAEDLSIEPSALSLTLQRLAADRLIARVADPRDQRRAFLRLTPAGRAAHAESERAIAARIAPLQHVRPEELSAALRVLETLNQALGAASSEEKTDE